MQHVFEYFLDPVMEHYTLPKHVTATDYGTKYRFEIAEQLKVFSPEVLKKAADHLRKEKPTTLPAIRTMVDLCIRMEQAIKVVAIARSRLQSWEQAYVEWQSTLRSHTPHRKEQAFRLVTASPFARQAAKEGWILFLYEHFRYHDHNPSSKDVDRMQRLVSGHRRAMQNPGRWAGLAARLAQLEKTLVETVNR